MMARLLKAAVFWVILIAVFTIFYEHINCVEYHKPLTGDWTIRESGLNLFLNEEVRATVEEEKQRIVIIGAGPTGLGAAHRLYELGLFGTRTEVIIVEQESQPGGLASSERDSQGFLWDMGGHVVFSHYDYFNRVLDEAVTEWNLLKRAAYVSMKGSDGIRRFIPYPVQDNIHVMDKSDQSMCLQGLRQVASTTYTRNESPTTFDQWLVENFGEGLCEVFMRKYNRKVWTVDTTQMNSVWVGERVAVPNITKIKAKIADYDSAVNKSVQDSKWGPNRVFRYPRYGGTGGIWKAVASKLPRSWFRYNHSVVKINATGREIRVVPDGDIRREYSLIYDTLISTAPLDLFLKMETANARMHYADRLVYSHTHVIGIGLKGQPPNFLADKSWMYFPDSDSPFYRVTVFSNYSSDHVRAPRHLWSLMCEAAEPNSQTEPGLTEVTVVSDTVRALVNYGFITEDQVVSKYHRRLEHGYPVPFLEREKYLSDIQPWLESNGIYSRGQFGGWRYEVGNQDHSFMQGVEVADRIMLHIPEDTYPDPNKVNSMQGLDRTLDNSLGLRFGHEFVIAHYNEDLKWLDPVANHCHVYHKGNESQPRSKFYKWEKLPNVGRECHTYLHHIISNYEHLANVTVFLQGSVADHQEECYDNPLRYIQEAKHREYVAKAISMNNIRWGRISYSFKYKKEHLIEKIRRSNLTLGEFWEHIFNYSHPKKIHINYRACFAVSRHRILNHSKEFYENILKYVSDHPDPEECHYVERLWASVFSPKIRHYS